MRRQISEISIQLYRRGFSPEDVILLRSGAERRLLASRAAFSLKEAFPSIIRNAVDEFCRRHPEKASQYTLMWEKVYRDFRMNLRYCLQCVALNDPEWGKQVVWWWFRTILKAFEFDNDFITEGYRILQAEIRKSLPKDEAEAIAEMIDVMIETLCFEHADEIQARAAASGV